ncbi:MAG: arylesterase [Nitrospiraceae bacterium]
MPVFFLAVLAVMGCEQSAPPSDRTLPSGSSPEGNTVTSETQDSPLKHASPMMDTRPRIVALGNSLTAGAGVAAGESYPARLQRRLEEAGFRYRVINAGVSGDTSAGGLRRIPWVLNSKPSIVILELGVNDGMRGFDLADVRSNLEKIITRLQAEHVTVVLAGMKLPSNYGTDYTARFAAIYPELAQRYHLTLMPFFLEGVAARPELNQPDGVHPIGEGYRIIVENVFKTLTPLLTQQPEAAPQLPIKNAPT